jgi:hypothetical protein
MCNQYGGWWAHPHRCWTGREKCCTTARVDLSGSDEMAVRSLCVCVCLTSTTATIRKDELILIILYTTSMRCVLCGIVCVI